MRRKLATVDIYFDEANTTDPSNSISDGHGNYEITINRNSDEHEIVTREQFQTTLAHELGHAVAIMTLDPTHNDADLRRFRIYDDVAAVLPAERKAWELARKMGLPLDEKHLADSLGSYEQAAAKQSRFADTDGESWGDANSWDSAIRNYKRASKESGIGWASHISARHAANEAKQTKKRTRKRVLIKIATHSLIFGGVIFGCVLARDVMEHWKAFAVASVSVGSFAVKVVEVLTDVIADRLLPGVPD